MAAQFLQIGRVDLYAESVHNTLVYRRDVKERVHGIFIIVEEKTTKSVRIEPKHILRCLWDITVIRCHFALKWLTEATCWN